MPEEASRLALTGLSSALRERVSEVAFQAGATILRQAEPVSELYILTAGTVGIVLEEDGGSRHLATLGPGAWLGELAMLTGAVSSTTVVAKTAVRALSIRQAEFLAAAQEDPTIFRELAEVLARRLRSADHLLGTHQQGRAVLLWHKPELSELVKNVLDECFRWAAGPILILSDSTARRGKTPREYVEEPARLEKLERKLASGAPVTIPAGDPSDPLLSPFLGLVSKFAPLIVIAVSDPISPTTMPRVTETVTLEDGATRSGVTRLDLDVPHDAWKVGPGFDAARVARRICRQQIGLALGGGASRGFAHLGVLKALEREGVPIDVIAGTSIGAAIAAHVAGGDPLDKIAASIEVTGRASLLPQLVPAHSIFTNFLLEHALRRRFGRSHFSDLALPLGVTTVDLETAEELVFTTGELVPALMASMAVPGIFPPVRYQGRILIDGGLRIPVPVGPCYDMGADIVIASHMRVEADSSERRDRPSALPLLADSFSQALDIMQDRLGQEASQRADVDIETAIPRRFAGLFDFRHRAFVEAAGEAAAQDAMVQIFERISGLRRADASRAARLAA